MLYASVSRFRRMIVSLLIVIVIWMLPHPNGVQSDAWHLFAIFMGTLSLVISGALPMGAGTLIGITAAVASGTLTFKMAFGGYEHEVVWLVLIAFFISQGFILTGLGKRISYCFVSLLGKKTLGLGYGLSFAELMLAPVIPSVTARSGAIIFPIAQSLSHSFKSHAGDDSRRKLGSYMILVSFHAAAISSAMFLTAMAGNPLAVKLAKDTGIDITWSSWATYAFVPGVISLLMMPLLVYWLSPPEIKETPDAPLVAKAWLQEMGPMTISEKQMLGTFTVLLFLWVFGPYWGIKAVTAALLGLVYLLVVGVVQWKDLLSLTSAWDTFIWFGAFVALAEGLNHLGLTTWFGKWAALGLGEMPWALAVGLLVLIYFYAHYFFASSTAQVGAMYLPFLLVALNLGAPPLITALIFGYISNLYGGLTHYGFGSAPILFGSGFVTLKEWWRIGFVVSTINLIIWIVVGAAWWNWLLKF